MPKNNWTRNELVVAFNLYCKTPFTKIDANNNSNIKELAPILGRSANALAMKLANFARLDPALKSRGIKGLSGGSKGEESIWNEFNSNWEELAFESERILAEYKGISIETQVELSSPEYFSFEGKEKHALVKLRVNQDFFRKSVLASYNNRCCVTGISVPELLVAGHIIPWSADKKNRMNPANGLCMNALHDRAFDKGLITVTPDYELKIADKILHDSLRTDAMNIFNSFNKKRIITPQKFFPAREFLEYHNKNIFIG